LQITRRVVPVFYTVQNINGDYAYMTSDEGVENQVAMIGELRQAYPRRPALRDELERVERRIGESRGR